MRERDKLSVGLRRNVLRPKALFLLPPATVLCPVRGVHHQHTQYSSFSVFGNCPPRSQCSELVFS